MIQDESVFFFFSSRRRHTRLQGDWSSDVCSSDLHGERLDAGKRRALDVADVVIEDGRAAGRHATRTGARSAPKRYWLRSEERRVGKECRARRGTQQYKE